ncbi:MAG: molybdate ABC transporter substrate-binding protein [Planctomycetes bacterium]|nr:molybdate ABC transporter substrate-binding protein [Planctomycetota bacterium]
MKTLAFALALLLGSLFVGEACADKSGQETATLLVAASTKNAFDDIAKAYATESGQSIKISTGASNALAAQIEAGAPADLYLSANPKWVDEIATKGHLQERYDLLGNRLVLVVPKGNPAAIQSPSDLLSDKVQHVALAGESVPAGMYAEKALHHFGVSEKLAYASKITRGSDVRVALSYVERGEAQAGVVYATDARDSTKVEVVYTFPDTSHDPIRYPLALLKKGAESQAAKAFFKFVQSAQARKIFEAHGFILLQSGSE